MPAIVDWLIEGKVIYQYWWGIGTLQDVHDVNAQTLAMYAEYPNQSKVHTIADSTNQDIVQSSISDIRRSYTAIDHPQTGWVILITDKSAIRIIGNILLRISPVKFYLVKTLDSALTTLERVEPTIDLSAITHEDINPNVTNI